MFILAHLSDPHLAPLPKARLHELFGKRITGFANWYYRRRVIHDPAVLARLVAGLKATGTDHIAVTGDFANIALPAEFEQARAWLAGLGGPYDVTAIPGNHDAYVRGALAMMQHACGAYMRGDNQGEAFPFLRRRGPVALIGLSTAVPTAPLMATGWLGENQIKRLGGLLDGLKREGLFRTVLIHHPPASEAARHKRLVDAADFLRVIAGRGAELIIHGHDHIHQLHWLDGPDGRVPAIGVPSASAAPGTSQDAAGYNLYRIDGQPGAWRCEMETRGITGDGELAVLKRTVLIA
jgi:3',5'-cyclic AMP phosphodiesterase CpdA